MNKGHSSTCRAFVAVVQDEEMIQSNVRRSHERETRREREREKEGKRKKGTRERTGNANVRERRGRSTTFALSKTRTFQCKIGQLVSGWLEDLLACVVDCWGRMGAVDWCHGLGWQTSELTRHRSIRSRSYRARVMRAEMTVWNAQISALHV